MKQLRIHIIRNFRPFWISQLPIRRLIKNILNGKILGMFHPRSHYRFNENGEFKEKVTYTSYESALRAAESMAKKKSHRFSAYGCLYYGQFHIGANRYTMNRQQENQ